MKMPFLGYKVSRQPTTLKRQKWMYSAHISLTLDHKPEVHVGKLVDMRNAEFGPQGPGFHPVLGCLSDA